MDLQTKTSRLCDVNPELAREYAQKYHRKKEDFSFVQKFYASDKAEIVEAERAVVSYISTATVDRDNEVLLPKGMKAEHYEKSGKPVFWGHKYGEPRDVVGQCQWLKPDTNKGIVAKTAFRNNEFSDEVYHLYSDDLTGQGPILRGFSVGFIPLEWEDGKKAGDPRRTFTAWELLEYSCVSIPCNPEAQTILNQKGIKLCDRLIHDLEIDVLVDPVPDVKAAEAEVTPAPVADAPETPVEPEPEVKAPEPEAKVFGLDQNPSVADIWSALDAALNPVDQPMLDSTYKCLWDIYPVDYPSGKAVYGQRNADNTANEAFLVKYTYGSGTVSIGGTPVAVSAGYVRRREGKGMGLGSLNDERLREVCASLNTMAAEFHAFKERAAKLGVWIETNIPLDAAPAPDTLTLDPSPDIEIEEPAKPEPPAHVIELEEPKAVAAPVELDPNADIAALVKGVDWAATIRDVVKVEIARARGILL